MIFRILCCLFLSGALLGVIATEAAPPAMTKAQAIQTVRTILQKNTTPCKINKVRSVTAQRNGAVWRVTARIVMSASGKPLNETAVWGVSEKNGATPMNQLTAELSKGCP